MEFNLKQRKDINENTKNSESFIDFYDNPNDVNSLLSRTAKGRHDTSKKRILKVIEDFKSKLKSKVSENEYEQMKEEYIILLEQYEGLEKIKEAQIQENRMLKTWDLIKNYCSSTSTLSQYCREYKLVEHQFRRQFDHFKKTGSLLEMSAKQKKINFKTDSEL